MLWGGCTCQAGQAQRYRAAAAQATEVPHAAGLIGMSNALLLMAWYTSTTASCWLELLCTYKPHSMHSAQPAGSCHVAGWHRSLLA
jgi:hypothetical protein